MDDGLRQADALAVAFGQLADQLCRARRRRRSARPLRLTRLARLGARHALQFADKCQVFLHLHFRIHRRSLRQIADALLHFDRLLEHVEAGHGGAAFRRRKEAGQNAHGRGFPGAVRSEKADDLALLHFKRNVIHRERAGVSLREALNCNHS